MEQTKLFVAEPFVEGNKNLANTVILYEDWIFYIDEHLDVFCRTDKSDQFPIEKIEHQIIGTAGMTKPT